MRIRFTCLFLLLFLISCLHHKKSSGEKNTYASDRSVQIHFYPFWGGSASCELERKKGTDQLVYTYHVQKAGTDTSYFAFVTISSTQADSVFALAEKVNWDPDVNYGTVDDKNGLRVNAEYKKGPVKKQVLWERMANANELPPTLFQLAQLLNSFAPQEMKLY
jgi:hypothetical protein